MAPTRSRVELTDGRTLSAKLIGTDKPSDLALLKVAASGFTAVAIGDSDAVRWATSCWQSAIR